MAELLRASSSSVTRTELAEMVGAEMDQIESEGRKTERVINVGDIVFVRCAYEEDSSRPASPISTPMYEPFDFQPAQMELVGARPRCTGGRATS